MATSARNGVENGKGRRDSCTTDDDNNCLPPVKSDSKKRGSSLVGADVDVDEEPEFKVLHPCCS